MFTKKTRLANTLFKLNSSILPTYLAYSRLTNLNMVNTNELANKSMWSSFQRFPIHYKEHVDF